ncbi:hypothetical protein GOV09_00610 [Candidatus Woesearchaeota archaeon]|nr:hypothetical protein [Candidatus Woesearchaeota archaeon]
MEGIINSDNSTIAKEFKVCTSIASKMRGLMFSKKRNLIFVFPKEQRISLHMLFVFFPIWVVYLDEKKKVVAIRKLLPFISFCYPKEKAKYIIELAENPSLKTGDKLSW